MEIFQSREISKCVGKRGTRNGDLKTNETRATSILVPSTLNPFRNKPASSDRVVSWNEMYKLMKQDMRAEGGSGRRQGPERIAKEEEVMV